MIDVIFTIDCDIYGNGCGDIKELLLESLQKLIEVFNQFNLKFVNFMKNEL